MYKQLRILAVICVLALTSNIVGVSVVQLIQKKFTTALTVEEDNETNQNSGKRVLNLMEEEMHLDEHQIAFTPNDFHVKENKTNFHSINQRIKEVERIPLEIPPEYFVA